MSRIQSVSSQRILLVIAFVSLVAMLSSQPAPREQVGPLPGGAFLLNSGWRLDPVGRQVPLDTLPDVLGALARRQVPAGAERRIQAALDQRDRDRHRRSVTGSVPVADGWLGLAILAQGRQGLRGRRLAGRRSSNSPSPTGSSPPARTFAVVPQAQRADAGFHRRRGPLARRPPALRGRPVSRHASLVVNPQSGMVIGQYQDRPAPLPHPVSSRWQDLLRDPLGRWHGGPVRCRQRQPDRAARARRRACQRHGVARRARRKPPTGETPPYTARIFVAAANTNNVFAVGVTAGQGTERGGEHQRRDDAAPAAGHDALARSA